MNTQTQLFDSKMNPVSLYVYKELVLPTMTDRQSVVYGAIQQLKEATCHDVAMFLNVPVNTISGRFSELKRKNKIEKVGEKKIGRSPHSIYKVI